MPRQTLMRWLTLIILAAGLLFPARAALSQSALPPVVVMRLSGPVNPIWQETIKRALQMAELRGAGAVIIELDTPGGSINTMTALVQQMRASPVPLIVYVTPAGAMAASAGTLITLAGHAAVMAPETTIGAASPVGGQGEDIATTEATKVKEVMKATVRGLAAILANGLNGATPEQIISIPADFYAPMNLQEAISYQRLNGFQGVLAHMKQSALKLMSDEGKK